MYRFLSFFFLAGSILARPEASRVQQRPPVVFEPNRGQGPAQIQWMSQGNGYGFLFTKNGVTIRLAERQADTKPRTFRTAADLHLTFEGGRPWDHISGLEATGGVSNYLHRGVAPDSIIGIPQYARLRVAEVYAGIDVDFYDDNGNLEYDFILHPGADPKQIRVALDGQRELRVDSHSGDLIAVLSTGSELRQHRPKVYQQAAAHRTEISGGYALEKPNIATFQLGAYDVTKALTIDPTLQATELVGQLSMGTAIAVDSDGNKYITGNTSYGLPVTNNSKYDPNNDNAGPSFWGALWDFYTTGHVDGFTAQPSQINNSFVTKLSPTGAVLYSTYTGIGYATGIAVDSTGIVVTGFYQLPKDLPDNVLFENGTGPFVYKLTLSGTASIYDSSLQLLQTDGITGVALDSQHNAWLSGYTSAQSLAHGATQSAPDAFLIKIDPRGVMRSSHIYGGRSVDEAYAVAVDKNDNVWATGQTCSQDFRTPKALNRLSGRCGVFVVKLRTDGTGFSEAFGGGDHDAGRAIAVNANGLAYVAGVTEQPDFIVSPTAFQNAPTGPFQQGFIMQIDDTGDSWISTLIGSNASTTLNAIALNAAGEVYVGGSTLATNFPGNGPVDSNPTAGLIMKFNPDLTTLLYSRQQGALVTGVAIQEAVPAVTPAKIYTAGSTGSSPYASRAFVDVMADDLQNVRIRNYWKKDEYLNIQSRVPTSGPIELGWYSAIWTLEQQAPIFGETGNPPAFWIHNFWKRDEYLNIQNGLQSTLIGQQWLSAHWMMEPVAGATNLYRIRNVWQPNLYLNNQNGVLAVTEIESGWYSAMWTIERVY